MFYTSYIQFISCHHTLMKMLRTKCSLWKSIFTIPLGKSHLPTVLVLAYPSPHSLGGWALPQYQQWSPRPLQSLEMLAGSEKPDSWISHQCWGYCLCSDGHNVNSPGRYRNPQTFRLFTVTVHWPQETQMSEGPENFCTLSCHTAKIAWTFIDATIRTDTHPLTSHSHPHSIISVFLYYDSYLALKG